MESKILYAVIFGSFILKMFLIYISINHLSYRRKAPNSFAVLRMALNLIQIFGSLLEDISMVKFKMTNLRLAVFNRIVFPYLVAFLITEFVFTKIAYKGILRRNP